MLCGCTSLHTATIPDGVTHIGNFAFQGCMALAHITLPASLTHIGGHAFCGCTSVCRQPFVGCACVSWRTQSTGLLCYHVPFFFRHMPRVARSGILGGFFQLMCYCVAVRSLFPGFGLTVIKIPGGVVEIGNNAFADCGKLTHVTVPASVRRIGASAFVDCVRLAGVTLPNTVEVGESAFEGCNKLRLRRGTAT